MSDVGEPSRPGYIDDMRQIPLVPLVLGLAGLVPFWGLAVALVVPSSAIVDHAVLERALSTYAAVIISFLGGVRWGLAAASTKDRGDLNFAVSVLPSLVAWALLAAPQPWRLVGLGIVAFALGPIDATLVVQGLAPRWLGRLRIILSTGAALALLIGAAGPS